MINLTEVNTPISIPRSQNSYSGSITFPLLLIGLLIIGSVMLPFIFKQNKHKVQSNNKVVTMTAKLIK